MSELLLYAAVVLGCCLGTMCLTMLHTTKSNKKYNEQTALDRLREQMPKYIQDAERSGFKDGKAKKDFVIRLSKIYLSDITNKTLDEITSEYLESINQMIETYLEIPQATKYKE